MKQIVFKSFINTLRELLLLTLVLYLYLDAKQLALNVVEVILLCSLWFVMGVMVATEELIKIFKELVDE